MPEQIEKLALLSQKGNREAFSKLYDLFMPKIYSYVYYRCFSRSTAEDVVSQAFLKALEHLNQFTPQRGSFSSWLYRIAHNCLMDFYKDNPRVVNIDDISERPSTHDLESEIQDRNNYEKIKPFLDKLNEDQREILILRLWDNMSYREISGVMGRQEAACKMQFSRAIAFLRSKIPLNLFIIFILLRKIVHAI